jgi:L-iditol 2-dehydrogenase
MRAAVFLGPNDLDIQSVPAPTGKIRAKVKACAVCGYDARVFRNGHRKVSPPVVLGHEICAELVGEVRSSNLDLKAGSRVVIYPQVPCLECQSCSIKRYNLCLNLKELGSTLDGGFAEYVEIPENIARIGGLIPLPDQLSDDQAALLEPLACCLNSVSRMGIEKSESSRVAIIGDGPIGLMHLQLCRQMGAQEVCVIGRIEPRMQKAKDLGADYVVKYQGTESTAQAVKDSFSEAGADFVVIATSNPSALELSDKVAGKNSVINIFAGMPQDQMLQIDANRAHYSQISVIGSFGCTPTLLSEAATLAAQKEIDLSSLITRHYDLSEVRRAFEETEKYAGLRGVVNKF